MAPERPQTADVVKVDQKNKKQKQGKKDKKFWSLKKTTPKSEKAKSKATKTVKTPKNSKTKNKKPKTPNKVKWTSLAARTFVILFIILFLITVSFAGAVYAYQDQYEGRALHGTKIFGQEMGGLTKKELIQKVNSSLSGVVFKFAVDGTEITATPEEIGVSYLPEITAENAYGMGRADNYFANLGYSAVSLAYKLNREVGTWLAQRTNYKIYQNVDVGYLVDDAKLDAYTQKISKQFDSQSQDASLIIKGDEIQVIPAVYGRMVSTDAIKAQIKEALDTKDSSTIGINVTEVRPDIIEAEIFDSVEAAQKIINLPVQYAYIGKTYTPTRENIGRWIVFKKSNAQLQPVVDSTKVAKYLEGIAAGINIAAVNQKVTVVDQGQQTIDRAGRDGLAIDVNTAAAKTTANLNSGTGITLPLTTYIVKFKTEVNNVLVADWNKYIEVDISSQQMCAYLAGGEKVNCWAITTGQDNVINGFNTNTPTGTFLIRRKAGAGGVAGGPGGGGVCMPNPPDKTPLCGINYVSTFTAQGHAIHEAWWRRNPSDANYFGNPNYRYNGSHGCVNSPYDVAKFIYYWAPIGTPVIIHY